MCGRYYVNDDTAKEIERIIAIAQEKLDKAISSDSSLLVNRPEVIRDTSLPASSSHTLPSQSKDIHPTDTASVLIGKEQILCCHQQKWGMPGFDKKQVLINARSESAMEKPTFRDAMAKRRIVVPAAGFYEWNQSKEKSTFYRKDHPAIFMAGLYNPYEDGERFVILTTAANPSMEPVHDRMPLLLEEEEILPWILDSNAAKEILKKVPYLLERKTDFEQMSLF